MDRSWMYDRVDIARRELRAEFIHGVKEFVKQAKKSPYYISEGG